MRLFSDASLSVEDPLLRRAYTLAERARGSTSPNPLVGSVVVSGGIVVGEGFHTRAGEPHAEVLAMREAGERARGGTLYTTLEPCNHHGRTPPCTDSVIAAGISRVVIGMSDPNPAVEGGGAERLRREGVDIVFAADPMPFIEQNEAWLKWTRTGVPWVQVKTAVSLDGHPSAAPKVRTRLTGREAEGLTMRLRAAADAVLVGGGTLAADDPALTVRSASGDPAEHQPVRVVLTRTVAPRPDARLFREKGRALVLAGEGLPRELLEPLRAVGAEVVSFPDDASLASALRTLADAAVTRVLAEAGPGLFTALWREALVDELVLYHAGGVTGPAGAPLFSENPGLGSAIERFMHARETGIAGDDAVTVWRPRVDAWQA